jgi:ABC-2 type transport system ATP-binding protein
MSSVESSILVRNLRVVRGHKLVLPELTVDVAPARVTGLLGPSGSGKTTLMRAIVGAQLVAGGEVVVLGRPAGSVELRRLVGYVTQSPSVYADLTVRENLRYFARIVGAPRTRVDEVIAVVGLRTEADQVVATLSGGERARASLATALLQDPEVLVLDEPTVGLDPVLRRQLWDMFRELAGRGRTLLVSSHVMDEAARCDELILLREGRVLAVDTPDGILRRTGGTDLDDAFLRLIEERS